MRKRLKKKLEKLNRIKKPGPNKKADRIRREEEDFKALVAALSDRMPLD